MVQLDDPMPTARTSPSASTCPENFALTNPLSAFALAAFELLDPDSSTYTLDVVSILNPPSTIRVRYCSPNARRLAMWRSPG